jgi:hypothetical protein
MAKAPEHVRTTDKRKFLGALPNDPQKPRVTLKAHPGVKLTPPASAGWYSTVAPTAWGMLGNDSAGDCVPAGAFHGQQLIEKAAQGVDTGFTTAQAIAMYSAISGYDPRKPSTDVGATLQDGLGFWRNTGLNGYKIEAFAEIDYRNLDLIKQCVADFGLTYAALEVPSSAMSQFDAGQPWDVVKRSQIEGGHCVPIVGYDAQYLYVVTWSAIQKVTYAFYNKYFEENWVPVDADWQSKTGITPSGLDGATANADYQALTGDTASPFPTVAPTPVPDPTPTPTPPATDAVALLTSLESQIGAFLAAQKPHHHGH